MCERIGHFDFFVIQMLRGRLCASLGRVGQYVSYIRTRSIHRFDKNKNMQMALILPL